MSNITYGKRDIKAIERRSKIDFIYKAIRKILRIVTKYNTKQIKTVAVIPKIDNEKELVDIVNKLAWAFPYKDDLKIYVSVDKKLLNFDFSQVKEIPYQRIYLNKNISHIKLVDKIIKNVDLVLIKEAKYLLKENPFILYKTEIIDKNYFSTTEGGLLQSGYYRTFTKVEKKSYEELSIENYKKMLSLHKNKTKSYCFVTGPSFDRYKNFSFEKDSFKVICNSIVKNDEFLEYIGKPDLLVFADPVFHFSPNEYSAVFRDKVLEVVSKYKCFVMVPEYTVPLLLAHYPELKDIIIGMKHQNGDFNFPTPEKFWIKSSANILTLYMLPVASAITDEINILGADGRNPNEKYFWQHSKSAQFSDLMQTVFETHPSFFRDRDYKDYYEEHCEFMKNLIEYGEKQGKKYYSLTRSYIPVLKERFKND